MNDDFSMGTILVVDDEFGPRESLRFLFKDQYEVICASGVDEGIACFQETPPDVVLMDIKMQGKNGIEGLRAIRRMDTDVSVIMLTGFGSLETAQEAIRHGASDYVKKPFDASEMRETVQNHINKTRMRRGRQTAYENLCALNEQLQAELSSKEHLAQLGQATSEFVHDIRNPLTVICGYVNLLMNNIRSGSAEEAGTLNTETTREYLEQMEKSVVRCQEMSQMWRSLTHGADAAVFHPCLIAGILNETCETLQPIARKAKASIDLIILDDGLSVLGDNLQLYRAMQNLASNAIQALPSDGTGRLLARLSREENRARIEILDNGCGIPPEKLDSIFSPYMTTKRKEGGMGIGLCITKKIIDNHHGTIRLANRPEGGAAAVVELPLIQE